MDRQTVLDLFAELSADEIRAAWKAGRPVRTAELPRGLWLGRAGGLPWAMRRFVRHVVGRDYFGKLVLDGWGVNVRVLQDGSHAPIPSATVPGGFKVDLPFRLAEESLDYGFHLLGVDLGFPGGVSQMRDFARLVDFAAFADVVPEKRLLRVGAMRGEPCDTGELLIGYIAPFGVEVLMGSPFGMIWWREVTEREIESARAHLRSRRLIDASCGRLGVG